jgi:RNA polymerase sigma-70 factor (ECF subfamily)
VNFPAGKAFHFSEVNRLEIASLVAGHQTNLFAFLYHMCGDAGLAEELTQEVFVRALRAAERYQPQGKLSTWLFSIAANVMRDHWRRQGRRQEFGPDELGLTPAAAAAEDEALALVQVQEVREALLHLPMEQRTALILRYFHDLSYAEIAEAMVCPVGTVRSRIHNGLVRLKMLLTEEVRRREGD